MIAQMCSVMANTATDGDGKHFVYRNEKGGMMGADDFIPARWRGVDPYNKDKSKPKKRAVASATKVKIDTADGKKATRGMDNQSAMSFLSELGF